MKNIEKVALFTMTVTSSHKTLGIEDKSLKSLSYLSSVENLNHRKQVLPLLLYTKELCITRKVNSENVASPLMYYSLPM